MSQKTKDKYNIVFNYWVLQCVVFEIFALKNTKSCFPMRGIPVIKPLAQTSCHDMSPKSSKFLLGLEVFSDGLTKYIIDYTVEIGFGPGKK